MKKHLVVGTVILIAMNVAGVAQTEDRLEARVSRLERRVDELANAFETLIDTLAGEQETGSVTPLAVIPKVRPKPGAVAAVEPRAPVIIVREKGPAALAREAPRRPEPGVVPELEEGQVEESPGEPRRAPRPAARVQPRSVVVDARSAVEDESRAAPLTGASGDDVSLRIATLQRRLAALTELARRRQSQPAGGLTPHHRAQLAELESQLDLLETLLTRD